VKLLFANQCARKESEEKETDQKKESARLLETLDRWGVRNLRALPHCPKLR
jgi:hypothetical protein